MSRDAIKSPQSGDMLKEWLGDGGKPSSYSSIKQFFRAGALLVLTSSTGSEQHINPNLYLGLLNDAGYEVIDQKGFDDFVKYFLPTLEKLNEYGLTGEDINDAMNLYSSWRDQNNNPEAFLSAYRYFLGNYPNPEINLVEMLSQKGITLPEAEYFPPCEDPDYCDSDVENISKGDPDFPNRV